jgi:GTPase SAR1 family protein
VVHPDSFHNISTKWLDELKRVNPFGSNGKPTIPYILVGTKTDLRDNTEVIKKLAEKNKEPISKKEVIKKKSSSKFRVSQSFET